MRKRHERNTHGVTLRKNPDLTTVKGENMNEMNKECEEGKIYKPALNKEGKSVQLQEIFNHKYFCYGCT